MSTSDLVDVSNADAVLPPGESESIQRVDYPQTAQPIRVYWLYAIPLAILHVLALLAFLPWFFSWSGLVIAIAGHFVFGMLGITIGYHRLLTHRGFVCPKWLEHTFAILGICNLQDSPARWVAIHRMHHQHSDRQPDPHTPLANFFWAHMGWVLVHNRDHDSLTSFERYARDLLKDPFYFNLERRGLWVKIFWLHAAVIALLGGLYGLLIVGGFWGAYQMAASWLVWGVFVRTVVVLHGTWSVNSLGHVFGYKNYKTRDDSRNNWLVALISHGEGWHNNHHAQPRAAHHGHRWFEFDMSWRVIWLLEKIGLAKDVVRAKRS
jgi:fatty-acid desaturase